MSKINSPPATAVSCHTCFTLRTVLRKGSTKPWERMALEPDSIVFTLAILYPCCWKEPGSNPAPHVPSHRLTITLRWIWGCEFQIWPTGDTHFSPSTECHNGDLKSITLKIASRKAENEESKNEQSWSPLGSRVVTGFAHCLSLWRIMTKKPFQFKWILDLAVTITNRWGYIYH